MTYVDGFGVVVPRMRRKACLALARVARVWKEHGALDYKECLATTSR